MAKRPCLWQAAPSARAVDADRRYSGRRRRGRGNAVSAVAERGRAVADVLETEEARGLLEAAQHAGTVNADEIALALDELELEAGQIEDFYHALDELQIEIVAAGQSAEEVVQ